MLNAKWSHLGSVEAISIWILFPIDLKMIQRENSQRAGVFIAITCHYLWEISEDSTKWVHTSKKKNSEFIVIFTIKLK